MIAVSCSIVRTRAGLVAERGFPPEIKQAQVGAPLRLATLLIQTGADVNAARQDGRTVLMSAAMVGWPEIVALLLEHHADVRARDKQGHVAMDYVQPIRDPKIVQVLRTAGADPPPTRGGRTVCDAQDRLGELGYGVDSEDCWWGWGNATTKALGRFQRDHEISETRQLDAATEGPGAWPTAPSAPRQNSRHNANQKRSVPQAQCPLVLGFQLRDQDI